MKYMGSKARFAKEIYAKICEITPRNGRAWVEPFAGGMNMICEVPYEDGPRYANDYNHFLIAMFAALLEGWIPPKSVSREFYNECRKLEGESHIIGYVGFNSSYSGKWFGGYAGVTITAKGTVRDYQDEAFRNIGKQVKKLNGVILSEGSYDCFSFPHNSIVYCDPPYKGTTQYKDDFDHDKFWEWVRFVSRTNDVYVSEYSAPNDFECVWEKSTTSSLSANGKSGGNKVSTEKLFTLKRFA